MQYYPRAPSNRHQLAYEPTDHNFTPTYGVCFEYLSMQEQSGSINSSDSKSERRNPSQRDRARRASETAAQKQERLRKRRVRDSAKRAAETKIREQPGLQGSVPTRMKGSGYRWRLNVLQLKSNFQIIGLTFICMDSTPC